MRGTKCTDGKVMCYDGPFSWEFIGVEGVACRHEWDNFPNEFIKESMIFLLISSILNDLGLI